jgi:hypothetical protein
VVDRLNRSQTMQKVITIYSNVEKGQQDGNVISVLLESEILNTYLEDGYRITQTLASYADENNTNVTLLLEKHSQA